MGIDGEQREIKFNIAQVIQSANLAHLGNKRLHHPLNDQLHGRSNMTIIRKSEESEPRSARWSLGRVSLLIHCLLLRHQRSSTEAEHPVHPRRQHRLRRHRRLRRRRAARGADAAHRSARRRRPAADAVPGRAGLHAVARRLDDGALFHPLRAVAGRGRGNADLAAGERKSPWPRCCATPAMPPRCSANGISAREPYSQPQNKGFDEFYGIPPAVNLGRVPDDPARAARPRRSISRSTRGRRSSRPSAASR